MNNFTYYSSLRNIVLKPGSAWRVDPGLESGWVEEKIGKEKTQCDPVDRRVDPVTRQEPVKNSVATR